MRGSRAIGDRRSGRTGGNTSTSTSARDSLPERSMAQPEPHILRYTRWLREERGLAFDATTNEGYDRLWRWSCADLGAFWQSIWDYFGVFSPTPHTAVLAQD